MARAGQKVLFARLRRAARAAVCLLGAAVLALVVDQFVWAGPMVRYVSISSRFQSRCGAIKPGMNPTEVIDLMNKVAMQQYWDGREMEFDRLLPRSGTSCRVELDERGKVQTVRTGDLGSWMP